LPVALGCVLALVVQLLALRERQLQFRLAARIKIELERNDGHPLALDGGGKLVDLALVQQQAAGPAWLVLKKTAGRLVVRNKGIEEKEAPLCRGGIALGDVGLAGAQCLYLGARQRNPGLVGVFDVVGKARLAVLSDALAALLPVGRHDRGSAR